MPNKKYRTKKQRTKAINASKLKYDRVHVMRVGLNFNRKTDADIIELLSTIENKSAFFKELIREYIKNNSN